QERVVQLNASGESYSSTEERNKKVLSRQVLKELTTQVSNGMYNDRVSGMFIILGTSDSLEKEDQDQTLAGISIVRSPEGELQLECGPEIIMEDIPLEKSENWKERWTLRAGEDNRYYYEPIRAANNDPMKRSYNLGYWYSPYEEDTVFSYTIPLISKNNMVYGIVGIKITEQQIREILPYSELDEKESGIYVLAQRRMDNQSEFYNMVKSEKQEEGFLSEEKLFSIESVDGINQIYSLTQNGSLQLDQEWYCTYESLELYEDDSPFSNVQWVIMGFLPKENLLEFVKTTQYLLMSAVLGAVIIGILGSLAAIKSTTRQISDLAGRLSVGNYNQPIRLGRTRIEEIDRLAEAIEYLSDNVAESASRLQKIISIADVGIAAFEYDTNSHTIHFMGSINEILKMPPEACQRIPAEKIKEAVAQRYTIESQVTQDEYKIYSLSHKQLDYWLSMKLLEEKDRIIGVFTDVTKEMKERRKLEYERNYDILTTLMNRRAFSEIMENKLKHPSVMKVAALLMLDLDNLKFINDSYGHDWGDTYLKNMAESLKRIKWEKKITARLSGDEFIVLLYGADTQDELRKEFDQLYTDMNTFKMELPDGERVNVRASGGVAWYPIDSTEYSTLMRYADFAMYQVKNTSKGKYLEFNREQYERDSYLLEGGKELNRFLEERKVEYHFQPIVNAKDGSVFGYEAFIRPKTEMLKTPKELLSVARVQSKLYQIEKMTWFEVMQSYEESRETIGDVKIFVNSIPSQVLSDRDKYQFEQRYGHLISNMVIETTYRVEEDIQNSLKGSSWLQRYHVQTALDGFGSSYNNEKLLLSLSPDYIKIDRELIRNIDLDTNRQMIVGNVITYAKKNNIKVVAEGIETREELQMAICLGADYLQGYYLGIPSKTPTKLALSVSEMIQDVNCGKTTE
ncbi:EAL domain-containing protein, partial [Negativibacillus massiliensis]|uniref:EAL domain-containing protein n=1 Tax=Negativibacillus massiliensis TaxID=1871035 RepID=UPI003AF76198